MSGAVDQLRMSLADIALFARVQRPVVSMWRTRSADTDHPFPGALRSADGRETFDAAEVSAWLAATGRGNNRSPSDDVAAFAAIDNASPRTDRTVFDAVTALLCLGVVSGRRVGGIGADELLDLADEYDPDDELLYAELQAVGDRLGAAARYADLLADASVSPQAAFERLMADRFRSGLVEHASTAIAGLARALVAKIAVSLAGRNGGQPVYVDSTACSTDLLLAVAGEEIERRPFEVMTARSSTPAARLARRRLRVHDMYREDLEVDQLGTFTTRARVTHIAQFPNPAMATITDSQILAAIENIVLQMDDSQNGVVVAPASALSDGFADAFGVGVRADMLRAGHIRAVVRLPKGLVPAKTRQALALWVLGPSHHEDEPEERRTMVADLADIALTDQVVDSLVTDVTAATGSRDLVRAHAFRFLRPVPTRTLLAAKRSLVDGATPHRSTNAGDTAELLLRVEQLRVLASGPVVADVHVPAITQTSAPGPGGRATIGGMLDARRLRLVAGARLADDDIGSGSGTRVIGVAELVGGAEIGLRTIDRLLLADRYESARLTEPGDIVFCTSPRPAAFLDRDGASVVAYPARVLRVDSADPSGLLAAVITADINVMPPHARQFRRWTVRKVADEQRAPLTAALTELAGAREQLEQRLDVLDELTDLITRAATSGALTLYDPAHAMKGS